MKSISIERPKCPCGTADYAIIDGLCADCYKAKQAAAAPGIVAECWTCVGHKADSAGRFTIPFPLELACAARETHGKLGHDVRELSK